MRSSFAFLACNRRGTPSPTPPRFLRHGHGMITTVKGHRDGHLRVARIGLPLLNGLFGNNRPRSSVHSIRDRCPVVDPRQLHPGLSILQVLGVFATAAF